MYFVLCSDHYDFLSFYFSAITLITSVSCVTVVVRACAHGRLFVFLCVYVCMIHVRLSICVCDCVCICIVALPTCPHHHHHHQSPRR